MPADSSDEGIFIGGHRAAELHELIHASLDAEPRESLMDFVHRHHEPLAHFGGRVHGHGFFGESEALAMNAQQLLDLLLFGIAAYLLLCHAVQLLQRGQWVDAGLYIAGSIVLSIAATALGWQAMQGA